MTTPDPRGASVRLPGDGALARLRADVAAARSAVQVDRRGPQRLPGHTRAAEAVLLDCLEAYARALAVRRLPLPRRLRDELRLRRRLAPDLP
jgi:hypothetical protein